MRIATLLFPLTLVVAGCTLNETQYPLNVPAQNAPGVWGGIMQCGAQRNYKVQDVRANNGTAGSVNLYVDSASTLEISYTIRDGQLYMDTLIWGKVSDEDRKRLNEDLKSRGLDVWQCAQQASAPK